MESHDKPPTTNSAVGIIDQSIIIKDELSKSIMVLSYEDVFAFLSYGNYVKVITVGKVYISHNSMKQAEARYCSTNRFIRISRTTIVSKKKIRSIEINRVKLSNGEKYTIGRSFRSAFIEKFKRNSF